LSIREKIVGLSVILLSIMLAAAIFSYVQTRRVHEAAHDATEALLPLSQDIAAIENHTLEEALVLERALRHRTPEALDLEQSARETARFHELDSAVAVRIDKAGALIQRALADTRVIADAVELARIEPELGILRAEHDRYREAGRAVLDMPQKPGNRNAAGRLQAELSKQEDRLDESIDRLAQRVASAMESETALMRSREARAYLSSTENLAIAILAFLAGAVLSALVTARLVKPVKRLISGAEQVAQGNLDVSIQVDTTDEIGTLASTFRSMVAELRSKARIKDTFGKYLDPRVVERLLEDGNAALHAGEKRVMTVFFSDLEGFSTISESLTPAGLVNLINSYLTLASEPIVRNQGVIDKYIGDAIMAFWGPPFTTGGDHAKRACLAALAQSEGLAELRRTLPDILGIRKGVPEVRARIGLCTGELIVGSIGSNVSKSFTVMGDTVNTASRLESANKQFGTRILMDGETFDLVREEMEAREIDWIGVKGKADAVRVYELLGERGKVEAARLALRDAFQCGLAAYRARDWDLAEAQFLAAEKIEPKDRPAALFLERVKRYQQEPPPVDWDCVWRLTEK
jgi:adenylate cyclase